MDGHLNIFKKIKKKASALVLRPSGPLSPPWPTSPPSNSTSPSDLDSPTSHSQFQAQQDSTLRHFLSRRLRKDEREREFFRFNDAWRYSSKVRSRTKSHAPEFTLKPAPASYQRRNRALSSPGYSAFQRKNGKDDAYCSDSSTHHRPRPIDITVTSPSILSPPTPTSPISIQSLIEDWTLSLGFPLTGLSTLEGPSSPDPVAVDDWTLSLPLPATDLESVSKNVKKQTSNGLLHPSAALRSHSTTPQTRTFTHKPLIPPTPGSQISFRYSDFPAPPQFDPLLDDSENESSTHSDAADSDLDVDILGPGMNLYAAESDSEQGDSYEDVYTDSEIEWGRDAEEQEEEAEVYHVGLGSDEGIEFNQLNLQPSITTEIGRRRSRADLHRSRALGRLTGNNTPEIVEEDMSNHRLSMSTSEMGTEESVQETSESVMVRLATGVDVFGYGQRERETAGSSSESTSGEGSVGQGLGSERRVSGESMGSEVSMIISDESSEDNRRSRGDQAQVETPRNLSALGFNPNTDVNGGRRSCFGFNYDPDSGAERDLEPITFSRGSMSPSPRVSSETRPDPQCVPSRPVSLPPISIAANPIPASDVPSIVVEPSQLSSPDTSGSEYSESDDEESLGSVYSVADVETTSELAVSAALRKRATAGSGFGASQPSASSPSQFPESILVQPKSETKPSPPPSPSTSVPTSASVSVSEFDQSPRTSYYQSAYSRTQSTRTMSVAFSVSSTRDGRRDSYWTAEDGEGRWV